MNVLQKAKIQLAKLLNLEFASISTDKGNLEYDGELEVGTEVFVSDEEGNLTIPEDGEYVAGNQTIVVEQGIVAAIEGEEEMAEDEESEDVEAPTGEYADVEAFNELVGIVNELIQEVQEIKDKMETLEADNSQFRKTLKMSVDKPASKLTGKAHAEKLTEEERFFKGWKEDK